MEEENSTVPTNNSTHLTAPQPALGLKMIVIIYGTAGFLIVVFNLLSLVVFAVNRHLRKRSVYLIMSLAVADLLTGLIALPQGICNFLYYPSIYTDIVNGISTVTMTASIGGLTFISVERMFATLCPLRHRDTSHRAYVWAIIVHWVFPGPELVVIFLEVNLYFFEVFTTAFNVLFLTVIIVAYISIYFKVKFQHQEHGHAVLSITQHRERELAKTLFIVTVLSLLTWLPPSLLLPSIAASGWSHETYVLVDQLFFANCFVNPIVYVFRMRDFRQALFKLFSLKRPRDRLNPVRNERVHRNMNTDITSGGSRHAVTLLGLSIKNVKNTTTGDTCHDEMRYCAPIPTTNAQDTKL